LTAVVHPDTFLRLLNRHRIPNDWVIGISDGNGLRVARSRGHAQALGTPFSPTLLELMRTKGPEGFGYTTSSDGIRVFTAYTTIHSTGWTVAVGIPEGVMEAGARASFVAFGTGIALSTLLGVLAALFLARSVATPMRELREAARALGRGERPLPPETDVREIAEVADALFAASRERAQAEEAREELLHREQEARATAEAANRAKDEFLAMLGHELRNPLGAISNAVQLLEHPSTDEPRRRDARGIIARQVSHLKRLTDDLLDAGRAVMGKIVLQRRPLDLAALTAQSLATLAASGRTQKHHVVEDLEPVWVQADVIRLDQVISNLVTNATKYTPHGCEIRVSVRQEAGEAVLRVRDEGIGLTPELAARVFDLFVQGDRELDRALGGLGIGLTLVRRLAEMHGGTATVTSEGPGRGAEFIVRLPAIPAPAELQPHAAPRAKAGGRRIVVVEDNADARESLQMLLELQGHQVEVAEDGVAGLELGLRARPEVMLVDVGLPRMDGYEVARRLRADTGWTRRPVLVAITGYGQPEDRSRALEAGFDLHVPKPVEIDKLLEILERGAVTSP
jgi:signal transduction histidine kinase/ActR/RegA family two-component response regulator